MDEITINEIIEKTKLSKKQITNWEQKGMIPKRIRVDKTGRRSGDIIIYNIKVLDMLKMLCNSPLRTSLSHKMGIEGMTWLLFAQGYRYEGIDKNIKTLLLDSFEDFKNSANKEINKMHEGELTLLQLSTPPTILLKYFMLKSIDEVTDDYFQQIFPNEISDDKLNEFANQCTQWAKISFKVFCKIYKTKYLDEYLDDFAIYIHELILYTPKFSVIKEDIINLDEDDLINLQTAFRLVLSIYGNTMGKINIRKHFRNKSTIYSLCIGSLYFYIINKYFDGELGDKFGLMFNEHQEQFNKEMKC